MHGRMCAWDSVNVHALGGRFRGLTDPLTCSVRAGRGAETLCPNVNAPVWVNADDFAGPHAMCHFRKCQFQVFGPVSGQPAPKPWSPSTKPWPCVVQEDCGVVPFFRCGWAPEFALGLRWVLRSRRPASTALARFEHCTTQRWVPCLCTTLATDMLFDIQRQTARFQGLAYVHTMAGKHRPALMTEKL